VVVWKLSEAEVREVRALFDAHQSAIAAGHTPSATVAEIGHLYAISRSTVHRVGLRLSHDRIGEAIRSEGDVPR
jgi:hypothetical protein